MGDTLTRRLTALPSDSPYNACTSDARAFRPGLPPATAAALRMPAFRAAGRS